MARQILAQDYGGEGQSIQFHPNTTYENFVGGLAPVQEYGGRGDLGFKFAPKRGFLIEAAVRAANPDRNYLLHIDEINRADLGQGPRRSDLPVRTNPEAPREITLAYDFGKPIFRTLHLPENLHVLGTMNSADRSIAILDVAVRRRFAFLSLWPSLKVVEEHGSELGRKAFQEVVSVFIEHAPDEALPLVPGHSYFLGKEEAQARTTLKTSLIPLLTEYLAQGIVEWICRINSRASPVARELVMPETTPATPSCAYATQTIRPSRDICLELKDHSRVTRSAVDFFGNSRASSDPMGQAARLADQSITQNPPLFRLLDVRVQRDYHGTDVLLHIASGNAVGAVPSCSPMTAQPDYGLVIQPRFPWTGIGPVLAEMGWLITPTPLKLPLLKRSERRVPPWVLSFMVLARLKALLDRLERRFELTTELTSSPKGTIDWTSYADEPTSRGGFLSVPCTFPNLRDDRQLKGAIRFAVEKQMRSLQMQHQRGTFIHQLIALAESLWQRVRSVPARRPGSHDVETWLRRPMRTATLSEGLQAIDWTVDERGLAGDSELKDSPGRCRSISSSRPGWKPSCATWRALRVRRSEPGDVARRWHRWLGIPPYLGSQRSFVPTWCSSRACIIHHRR